MIRRSTCARVEPSAIRTPISRVRRPAAYAITPYTPIDAITSATAANTPSSDALKRGPATSRDTSSSSVRTLNGGMSASSDSTSARSGDASASGRAPRTTIVAVANHWSTSVLCRSGR